MLNNLDLNQDEIFSKVLRAGRRTYFFDVRETKASDYYLTITESKKHTNEDGSAYYKKHKIYLYKEDFEGFKELFDVVTKFIIDEKGEEIISDYEPKENVDSETEAQENKEEPNDSKDEADSSFFTNIEFEDI